MIIFSEDFFQGILLMISSLIFVGLIIALGLIVSSEPLDDLGYKGWNEDKRVIWSPYASPTYIGWMMSSIVALLITGALPIASWFGSYRFTLSSAISVSIFTG